MATSTLSLAYSINWPAVIATVLGSSFLTAIFTGGITWSLATKSSDERRYEGLYGPLKFNLLMMKLLVENREDVLKDIQEWLNVETRIDLMQKHMSPLTERWIKHRDIIRELFEKNSGLIKKDDFELVSDFMDGCIKREIIEEGQNVLATNENRMNKILGSVKSLQDKLL